MPINGVELFSFMIVIMLMIVSPGANQILVLQSGLVLGQRAAIYNVTGIASSMFIHASLAGMGISLVIMKSPGLHTLIKLLGVGYLVYLALFSIVSAYQLHIKSSGISETVTIGNKTSLEPRRKSFLKGFYSNVLNIQTSFIFISIFPQYMNPDCGLFVQSLFLTLIFVGLLLGWYAVLITLISKIRHNLLKPSIQLKIKVVTGVLLLVMAIKLFLK